MASTASAATPAPVPSSLAHLLTDSDDESPAPAPAPAPAPKAKAKAKPVRKKRAAPAKDTAGPAQPPAKTLKTTELWVAADPAESVETACGQFVCNITQEIPLDPVMAPDGKVYERHALRLYYDRYPDDPFVNSPVTRERMAPTMLEVPQIRAAIRAMVASGMVKDADLWRAKLKAEAEFTAVLRSAEADNGSAQSIASMLSLTATFLTGDSGQQVDKARAFRWCNRAADHGCVPAMALLALMLRRGVGTARDVHSAFAYASTAASHGSVTAFFILGSAYKEGIGTAQDDSRAHQWLWAFANYDKIPGFRSTGPYLHQLVPLKIFSGDWKNTTARFLDTLERTMSPADRTKGATAIRNLFARDWRHEVDGAGNKMPFC